MTWCELFAVFAALSTYSSVLRHCSVLFTVDNETDVYVLNRQATRSSRLSGLLREIYSIALHNNIHISAVHRAGVDNVLADFLSRPVYHGGGDIVRAWRTAHPNMAHHLLSVSLVHSRQFSGRHVRSL